MIFRTSLLLVNKWFIFLMLCCLPGCAVVYNNYIVVGKGVDPRLMPYIQEFEAYGRKYERPNYRIPDMDIGFTDLSTIKSDKEDFVVVGLCDTFFETPIVLVDLRFWRDSTQSEKEILVFHELAHCALGRGHDESLDKDNHPVSIMYPSVISGSWFNGHKEAYMAELFGANYESEIEAAHQCFK